MLRDTILELADEIACDMMDQYLGGGNDIRMPELKYVVWTLHIEHNTIGRQLIESMLKESITERYNDMMEG